MRAEHCARHASPGTGGGPKFGRLWSVSVRGRARRLVQAGGRSATGVAARLAGRQTRTRPDVRAKKPSERQSRWPHAGFSRPPGDGPAPGQLSRHSLLTGRDGGSSRAATSQMSSHPDSLLDVRPGTGPAPGRRESPTRGRPAPVRATRSEKDPDVLTACASAEARAEQGRQPRSVRQTSPGISAPPAIHAGATGRCGPRTAPVPRPRRRGPGCARWVRRRPGRAAAHAPVARRHRPGQDSPRELPESPRAGVPDAALRPKGTGRG